MNPQPTNLSPLPDPFDPYHHWLGISPKDQPPDHYRLLGIERFESDPQVIDSMASRHMEFLQEVIDGPHMKEAQRLLNELATARRCLLNPKRKTSYDTHLKAQLAQHQNPGTAVPTSPHNRPTTAAKSTLFTKPNPHTVQRHDFRQRAARRRTEQKTMKPQRTDRRARRSRKEAWGPWILGIAASACTVFLCTTGSESNRNRSSKQGIPNRGGFTTSAGTSHETGRPNRRPAWTGPIPGDQLRLWLDASDQATIIQDRHTNIRRWEDKSGHACHAQAAAATTRPQWIRDLLCNQPAVRFTGSQWLEIPHKSTFFQLGSDYTILCVARGYRGSLLSKGTGETDTSFTFVHGVTCCRTAGQDLEARDNNPGRFQVRSILANKQSLRWYIDGALCGTYPNRNHTIEDRSLLRIGCYLRRGQGPESLFEGDLAELIIYSRCLPNAERRTVEKYLHGKWFIQSIE